jgi:hydroxyacylglutathione hydrolase
MFLQQFHLESLGHASYLLADESSGEALVVDPRRDVDAYLETARARGLRIAHAIDTHAHNDYLSGISEIVVRAPGVAALASAYGEFGYPHRPVAGGDVVEVGDVAVEILHTPGHTPEHVSLLVRDRSVADEPALLLSGGALLVGDVARPDLLGDPVATREHAEVMCDMLRTTVLALPDHVEVYPTHVAGSLCGGTIGARLSTTIGYERRTQILRRFGVKEEDIFLGTVNAGHPGGMLPLTAAEVKSFHPARLPANLYVADATLLPRSLGNPPILTIIALAKRVSQVCSQVWS